jgi:CheY-like chemotaxis protein
MVTEDSTPVERYEVPCFRCQVSFDASTARWCGCLVAEQTLVCPACGGCFCTAPRTMRLEFWSNAPKSLWDRKFAEHKSAFQPPANPPLEGVRRPLVLVVEDDPSIQRLALRAVKALGYGVVLARDGAEGLELARRYAPDAVLSDALMPRMDGRELCRAIKSDAATRGIKVAVMTSLYTDPRYKEEATTDFQVDEYLAKPLDLDSLKKTLEKLAGPASS